MHVPSGAEAAKIAFREALLIENHLRLRPLLPEIKSHNRINSRLPMRGPPSLHNSLVRNQLDVSPNNPVPKHRKGASRFRTDQRWLTGKRGEFLGIQQRLVNPLRAGLEYDFFMQRCAPLVISSTR